MMKDQRMLARLMDKKAVIVPGEKGSETYVALPRGDKRCRPVGFIDKLMLRRFIASGSVIKQDQNFVISPSLLKRTKIGKTHGLSTAYANQHRDLQIREVFNPDGLRRQVNIDKHMSVFRRLAIQKTANGQPFLMADEIEAGERFAGDYARSMMGSIATQNFDNVARDGKRMENTVENISISALDSRRRLNEALEFVGPGLDRALTALCGREWSMGQLETAEGWPKSSSKTVLKLALARLSAYYGCKPGQRPERPSYR